MAMYTVQFTDVAVTLDQDFFDIVPATNKGIVLHALYLSQTSDVGDAEEEMLGIQVIRGILTVGSVGSAPTPAPLNPNDAASSFTARANDTTIATAGTPIILHSEAFNVRSGYQIIWTPEMRPACTAGETRLIVRLMADTTDSLTMNGTLYVEEL
jgi:hypothetical protein